MSGIVPVKVNGFTILNPYLPPIHEQLNHQNKANKTQISHSTFCAPLNSVQKVHGYVMCKYVDQKDLYAVNRCHTRGEPEDLKGEKAPK